MSQSYDTQGTIHSIGETTEYGKNGFTKREVVLLLTSEGENPKYPQYIQFELIKDKCALLDQFQIGNEIKATFNLSGRLHNGDNGEKCYVSLQAWKMELLNIGQQQAPPPHDEYAQPAPGTQPVNYDAMIAEYNAADKAKCDVMWAGMDAAAQAALSAALT